MGGKFLLTGFYHFSPNPLFSPTIYIFLILAWGCQVISFFQMCVPRPPPGLPQAVRSYSLRAATGAPHAPPCRANKLVCVKLHEWRTFCASLQVCDCVPRSLSPVETQPGPGLGSFPLGAGPRKLPDSCSQSQALVIELTGQASHPQPSPTRRVRSCSGKIPGHFYFVLRRVVLGLGVWLCW